MTPNTFRAIVPQAPVDDAIRAIHDDGFVLLEGVVPRARIVHLRNGVLADVDLISARRTTVIESEFKGHVVIEPPLDVGSVFREVLLNKQVLRIVLGVLRAVRVDLVYYRCNVNLPGSEWQRVHADNGQLWPGLSIAPPAHALVANIPLVDVTAKNGPTELWPGTHVDTRVHRCGSQFVRPAWLTARRRERPPVAALLSAGSVMIRDVRLWHRGVPNRSLHPRPMLAVIYMCDFVDSGLASIPFGDDARRALRHDRVRVR